MQQLRETSSKNESCRAESEATLRGFLHFGDAGCTTCGSVPLLLAMFPSEVLKVLRLPRKIEAASSEVLCLPREMIFKISRNPKFNNATSLIAKRRKRWFLLLFAMCRFPFAFHAKRSAQGCGKSLAFKGNVCWLQLVV